ncbi:MAG: ABC transporter ATP-binding protein [Phycisphaerae bacterium]
MFNWTIKTRRGKLDLAKMRSVRRRFHRYVHQYRWALLGAFVGAVGATLMQLAAPWPIKVIFDYILFDKMSSTWLGGVLAQWAPTATAALVWVCAAILLIAVLDASCSYMRDVLLAQTGQRVIGKIRQDLFVHLQKLPPAVFERRRTGDLLTRLTGDILMLRQMLVSAIVTAGQGLLMIAAMVAVMFWLNPLLAALAIATVPLTVWATWRISWQIRRATHRQREKESVVASIAHDVLGAMAVIQAFNREPTEEERFARQNRTSVRAGVRTTRLESKLYRTVSLASAAGTCAILYFGVRAVLNGTMTAGDLLVFVAYLRALNKPMRKLAKVTSQLAKATSCGERVAELFAIEPAVRNRPGAVALPPVRGAIAFNGVTFSYDNGVRALSNATIAIEAGEQVAVVGHTGAGKSTLIKLLLRFYDPQAGNITIDGRDVRDVTTESLRKQIGWVHQDTLLFGMTVAENIALGREDAGQEAIRDVAARVQADEFIQALPGDYATVLGQSGLTLSGGQRQRIALARALLRRPQILALDEPATGLDELTRRVVEQAWMSPENKATTLVICHRLQDMERFDRVVFLSDGRVRACGRHRELLAGNEEYGALVAAGESHHRAAGVTEDARW